ncbi:MAG: hypothetical protein ACOYI8_09250 [Christensenellales bacterium]
MAYIRDNTEELTGYQESRPLKPSIDLMCDFVMVYGINESMPDRVKQFADAGYVVHLMTGIAWGGYQDYLDGSWDGRKHWDEGQKERSGKDVIHGPTVPYMVPTVSFSDYLTERLKRAVDSGVVAIHLEEPEFWDRSGYSEAFRREYEIRYREPFRPQHESLDGHYRSAKLKADLYARALSRVSQSVKEYAKVVYGRDLRFYVPTHSLINYTQWKILSPEAALIDIPTVDGFIAQVWTGTSREANVYEGFYRERTFETAFLEYGVMQELTRGTGKRMWFLNDPIEDLPSYTWENYRYNYQKTAVASLLNPDVWHYEICPWPTRVFEGKFPRFQPRIAERDETSFETPESKPIPDTYRTFLSSMFQLFGDMEQPDWVFDGMEESVGVFLSDSALFERTFPDTVKTDEHYLEKARGILTKNADTLDDEDAAARIERSKAFMAETEDDEAMMNSFISSVAFPQFYGLALPLLKYGLPVRPIQLDNVRRFTGYLKGIRYAVLSYEFMKPASPDINASLAEWVRSGGTLIYVGDGSNPFHGIASWWREAGYDTPAQHLFETLGLDRAPSAGEHAFGRGRFILYPQLPARICMAKSYADEWRALVRDALAKGGTKWQWRNDITLRRGSYLISAVMDESATDDEKVFEGCFADLLEDGFPIIRKKVVKPDEVALLRDLDRMERGTFAVVATAARILSVDAKEDALSFRAKAADRVFVHIRLRLPYPMGDVRAVDSDGEDVDLAYSFDEGTETALFTYRSSGKMVTITGNKRGQ